MSFSQLFGSVKKLTKEQQEKIKLLEEEADQIHKEFTSITGKSKDDKKQLGKLIEDYINKIKEINKIHFDRKRYAQIKAMQSIYYQGITLGSWKP